jgi:hypothetical protein
MVRRRKRGRRGGGEGEDVDEASDELERREVERGP